MAKTDGTEALENKPKGKDEVGKGGKKEEKKPEKKGAKKDGKTLREIRSRKLDDGSFVHEHHYEDKDGMPDHRTPEYSSSDLNDLHDHMDEHFGGGDAAGGDPGDAEQAGGPAAGGAAAGAAPAAPAAPEDGGE